MNNIPNINSSVSIDILSEKMQRFFYENNMDGVVYCDNCDVLFPNKEVIDIVLFGAGLKDIFKFSSWPKRSMFRIWVLNENHKRRLIKYIGFSESQVGVIDRYELFPRGQQERKFDLKSDKLSFIFSSRASTLKNYKLIVRFLNFLVHHKNKEIDLTVCAPLFKIRDFQKSIQCDEKLSIKFMGDLGTNWYSKIELKDNQALINMSLDPIDDFNVSLAQWQSIGGGAIISTFGPYGDIVGNNIYKTSASNILDAIESNYDEANLNALFQGLSNPNSKVRNYKIPVEMSFKDLCDLILNVRRSVEANLYELNSFMLNDFTREFILDEK